MRSGRFIRATTFFAVVTLITSAAFAKDQYIVLTGEIVNIRTAPNTSSSIVAKGQRGDVFKYGGEEGKWCKISMFSGEWRYVHKSLAEVVQYDVVLPSQVSTRRDIFRSLVRAEDRSGRSRLKVSTGRQIWTSYFRQLGKKHRLYAGIG